jgi:hypothetical protein
MAAVKPLGHNTQPDHVYHKKNSQGDYVKKDHLLKCHHFLLEFCYYNMNLCAVKNSAFQPFSVLA